jgi:hypothetical protein
MIGAVMPSEGDRMWKLLLLVTLGVEALLLMRLGSRCRAFPPVLHGIGCLGCLWLFSIVLQESESDVKFLVILAVSDEPKKFEPQLPLLGDLNTSHYSSWKRY